MEEAGDGRGRGSGFCSSDGSNLESCAQYLEQELKMVGLSSILSPESLQPDVPSMINCIYSLLQMYRHNCRSIEDVKASLQRARSDLQMKEEALSRLKDDLIQSQKQTAAAEERERQMDVKQKSLSSKLRSEQEEVRRLKLSIANREVQYNHDNKKREKEYERLKQKLGQAVSDKNQERRLGVDILNALQRADGKRRTWDKPGSSDEAMYHALVRNYEERQKELIVENTSLRESLASVQKEFVGLLRQKQSTEHETAESSGKPSPTLAAQSSDELLSSGHFEMPFNIVRDGIEQSFKEKCERVKAHIDELKGRIERLETAAQQEASPHKRDLEIEQLENKLSDYRAIIDQQEELLQTQQGESSQEPTGESVKLLLSESKLWREQEFLQADHEALKKEKEEFAIEKSQYMDAVRRLDRERQSFEDDKTAFLHDQFLDGSLLDSSKQLDSFYAKFSTPAPRSSSSCLQDGEVDLCHDLSLCSEDGVDVLNDKDEATES